MSKAGADTAADGDKKYVVSYTIPHPPLFTLSINLKRTVGIV